MEGLQSETTEPSSLRPAADAAAAAAAANANPANVDTAVAMVADGIQFERHSPVAGNTSHPTRLEGFWASSPRIEDDGYHGAYPWPTPSTQPWPRRTDWVGKLRLIQDAFEAAQTTRTTSITHAIGWNDKSGCAKIVSISPRSILTNQLDSTRSTDGTSRPADLLRFHEYDDATAQITWPEGLAHYVEVHHILPSLIFYEECVCRASVNRVTIG
ncbi:hypothetical protein CAOG_02670 [Capsaspora owczarzaki ATCC 30864]|uniref:hypothetical protein n=1 Tax=Capsaspora owczarzaki (strain ATCC 30864) TaxID=595528 RepID=UPI000352391E|nr:hypothetical protein CAOG_02670 [Capsaspora owczarzaki ATCC 30864]|eukprot:XP_004349420.2 hypothetical protein CAOG_02670 [Capsaspora owczarzaki ATCC 30864]